MLKSKIYPKSKHRLGCPSRVKIEDEKLKNADVAEQADLVGAVRMPRHSYVLASIRESTPQTALVSAFDTSVTKANA